MLMSRPFYLTIAFAFLAATFLGLSLTGTTHAYDPFTSSLGRPYDRPLARKAEARLLAVQATDSPEKIYGAFNHFVRHVYGAEADALIYEKFGNDLTYLDDGEWRYISERSATVAWESNIPGHSYVEYGPTEDLGHRTEAADRHYFLHIHRLVGLEPDQTYHYRVVAVDERGRRARSPIQTFTTQPADSMTPLGEDHEDGPIIIDQPGTYVLTRDIVSTTSGIEIQSDGVTLDLGGHTITYATEAVDEDVFYDEWMSYQELGSYGIKSIGHSNIKLLNGRIKQAPTDTWDNVGNDDTSGFNPIYIRGADNLYVAGVEVDYHSTQNTGIMNRSPGDNHEFHHNIVRDRGAMIANRHGAANRAIHFYGGDGENHRVRHNLVARSRQNGLNLRTGVLHNNEVYIDSWSINSFAMGVPNGPDNEEENEGHYQNRIFATGFNPWGFGWASRNLKVHNNFIYMHGLDTTHRWYEDWGDINLLGAFRITNYGGGGQRRDNLQYFDNLVIMRARQGADIQGTRFFSDESNEGIVFRNNIVKTERLDNVPGPNSGAIVVHGYFRKENVPPVIYRDSTLISNDVIVQFGEAYARGNNHHFENVAFVRIGNNPNFATFRFGGQYHSKDHVILDGTFTGGAAYDDVYWEATGLESFYSVRWTLDLHAQPGAAVTVTDADGEVEFQGEASEDGSVQIPLTYVEIRPAEWRPSGGGRLESRRSHQKVMKTPHTVTVTVDGQAVSDEVEMTEPRRLDLR